LFMYVNSLIAIFSTYDKSVCLLTFSSERQCLLAHFLFRTTKRIPNSEASKILPITSKPTAQPGTSSLEVVMVVLVVVVAVSVEEPPSFAEAMQGPPVHPAPQCAAVVPHHPYLLQHSPAAQYPLIPLGHVASEVEGGAGKGAGGVVLPEHGPAVHPAPQNAEVVPHHPY